MQVVVSSNRRTRVSATPEGWRVEAGTYGQA